MVSPSGEVGPSSALSLEDPFEWRRLWEAWNPGLAKRSIWGVSSVNPPVAAWLATFLEEANVERVEWFRSASDVALEHKIEGIETAGADRALAVSAALKRKGLQGLTLVVLCGSAITIERISSRSVWEGGSISLGLGMTSRALHTQTAQLPLVPPAIEPPEWGSNTQAALEAGMYWSVVGGIRELLTRQGDREAIGKVIWTGGDAQALAASVGWPGSEVVPDLVLQGLADIMFRPKPS